MGTEYNMKDLVRMALDCSKGNTEKYSVKDVDDAFRNILVKEFNCDKLDLRILRERPQVFRIMESLIDAIASETLNDNPLVQMLVETVTVAYGDAQEFDVEDDTELIVANTSKGNFGIRRQRLGEMSSILLKPEMHTINVYDELYRILAGKITTAKLVEKIGQAIEKKRLDDIYQIFASVGDSSYNVKTATGDYSEDSLFKLVEEVQAYNNSQDVMIVTTKKVARKIDASDGSEQHKTDIYNQGYATYWNGVKLVAVPQRFKLGTETFALDDKIFVFPINQEKPIKQVVEGSTYMTIGDGSENADQTVDIKAQLGWATGFISSGKVGVFTPTFS